MIETWQYISVTKLGHYLFRPPGKIWLVSRGSTGRRGSACPSSRKQNSPQISWESWIRNMNRNMKRNRKNMKRNVTRATWNSIWKWNKDKYQSTSRAGAEWNIITRNVERNMREMWKGIWEKYEMKYEEKYEKHESEREIPVDIKSRSRVKGKLLFAASCCCVPDYCRPD